MKRPPKNRQPSDQTMVESEGLDPDAPLAHFGTSDEHSTQVGPGNSPAEQGLRWLKYAGVGPGRTHDKQKSKLSGVDVTSLGSLEAEIMGVLWEIGQPSSGMEVMEASLYKRRAQGQEPIAFATIATTLRRLSDKGLLLSQKKDARTPIYTPTVGRAEMTARILNNVSVTLLGQPLSGLIPRLAGNLTRGVSPKSPQASILEEEEMQRLLQALQEVSDETKP